MIAVMTSTARGTPAPLSGPSQATAPVIEYRCMFCKNAHNKAKKWHDGSLRYHTFNKRVMVYDDSKNLVGSLHYRGDDEVGEGTELTLDRGGVLVEVQEPIGETETDLNQVLHQRTSPERPAAPVSRLTRLPAVVSQGRPKSLKEVLGASQGPIGRARVPSQTPYERRLAQESSHPEQPSAKRQRTVAGKENVPQDTTRKQTCTGPPRRPSSPPQAKKSWPAGSTQRVVGRVEEVYNLSSDEEDVPVIRRKTKADRLRQSSSRAPQEASAQATLSARPQRSPDIVQDPSIEHPISRTKEPQTKASKRKDKLVSSFSALPSDLARSLTSATANIPQRSYTPKPGTSQLRLAKTKPRNKLLFLSLPIEKTAASSPRPLSPTDQRSGLQETESPARVRGRTPPNARALRTSTEPVDIEDDKACNTPQSPASPTGPHGSADIPIHVSSSPLFMTQDNDSPPSPSLRIESSQEFEVQMLQGVREVRPGESSEHPISLSPKPKSPSQLSIAARGPFLDDDMDHHSPAPTQHPSQQQMPPPPLPPPAPLIQTTPIPSPITSTTPNRGTSTPRPFRRVLSENDAPISHHSQEENTDNDFPSLLPDTDFPPTAVVLLPSPNHPRRSTPSRHAPTGPLLRRTLSDPIAIDSAVATRVEVRGNNVGAVPQAAREVEGATGPWTLEEAWLLFDTWPAVKTSERAGWMEMANDIGDGVGSGTGGCGGGVVGPGGGGGFSSARGLYYEHTAQGTGVLRDEVGAL